MILLINPLPPNNTTACSTLQLDEQKQLEVREGDVYAAYVSSSLRGLPVFSSLPEGSGRSLYRDNRRFADIEDDSSLESDEMTRVDDVGMHIYADIRKLRCLRSSRDSRAREDF